MSEIAVREQYPVTQYLPDAAAGLVQWAQSAHAAYELAQRLITTSFAPAQYKGKPDEAAAAMLAGAEVGLSPMASLRSFDVIQGVAAPRAIALRAIVQHLGHEIVIDESTPERCVGRGRRRGSKEWQHVEWTIKRARDLGLVSKDQWKKQPQTMLVARFTSEVARLIAADAILGIPYAAEELIDSELESTVSIARGRTAPAASTKVQRKKAEPVAEAEPEFDQAEGAPGADREPAADPDSITDAQMKMLHATFTDKGFRDRDDRLDYVRGVLELDVQSSKDLTKDQASRVIDALSELSDVDVEQEPTYEGGESP